MSTFENIIRQLEDFVLDEHGLFGAGRIPFTFEGTSYHGYPYIRSSLEPLELALSQWEALTGSDLREKRFLEVGCGLGTKCELARAHGMVATGIDLKREYVELARQIFPACSFLQANALEFDYCPFDLVFYHVPFFDDSLLYTLETNILSQLPRGGILLVTRLSNRLAAVARHPDRHCSPLADHVTEIPLQIGRLRALQKTGPLPFPWPTPGDGDDFDANSGP